jgi:hypothetical protein
MLKEDSAQIPTQRSRIPSFRPDGPVMHPDAHISVKEPNSLRLHPPGCHDNTSRRTSGFKKIPAFLHRHRVGRQLAPVQTLGQHRSDTKILNKEIACIHSASV